MPMPFRSTSRAGPASAAGLAVSLALACVQAPAYDGTARPAASAAQVDAMSETSPATARVEGDPASLEATMTAPTPESVRVRYRLRNTGATPLAVFDRGNRQAVLAGRQASGAIAAPSFEELAGGDVVLRHVARAATRGVATGPTLPATPLALKLDPGAALEGEFAFAIPASAPPKRVRWCLGVAPFDAEAFVLPDASQEGEVWQATDAAVAAQQQLCTPWFTMATGRFEGEGGGD